MENRTPSEILDRLPPQDINAEMCVIGSILRRPEVIYGLTLRPEEFYADANRRLYKHLLDMANAGLDIDTKLLWQAIVNAGDREAVGGPDHLVNCYDATPVSAHAQHYAKLVSRAAKYRHMIHAATEVLRDAYTAIEPPEDILARAERDFQAIEVSKYHRGTATMDEAVASAMELIDQIAEHKRRAGVMIGLPSFDEEVGGIFPGELIILAARPGQGKTSLAMQAGFHAAGRGRLVYVASLEMNRTELALKELCSRSGVSEQRVRNANIGPADIQDLSAVSSDVAASNMRIDDWTEMKPWDIMRTARRLKPDMVIVDYLQLVLPSDRNVKRFEQVGQIAYSLRVMAKDLRVPVLACAQLNRQVDQQGKEATPKLSHLKESGRIEEEAHMVLLLYRPKGGITGKGSYANQAWDANLEVAKNRHGVTPTYRLTWNGERTSFSCYSPPGHAEFTQYSETTEGF